MADYTERFSEVWSLLADIDPASYTTEQNTGYVCLDRYHRAVVIIHCGVLGSGLDVDLEQGTDTSGSGGKTLDSGNKDITLTATTDNNTVSVIEIRTEELDVTGGFDCVNVEITPAGQGDIFGAQIWGGVPRYAPVSTTNLDSVTD
jgi:hypothetical protein